VFPKDLDAAIANADWTELKTIEFLDIPARERLVGMFCERNIGAYPVMPDVSQGASKIFSMRCVTVPQRAAVIVYGTHKKAFVPPHTQIEQYSPFLNSAAKTPVLSPELAATLKDIFPEVIIKDAPNVPLRFAIRDDKASISLNWPHMQAENKTVDEIVNYIMFQLLAPLQQRPGCVFKTQPIVSRMLRRRAVPAPVPAAVPVPAPIPFPAKPAEIDLTTVTINIEGGKAIMTDARFARNPAEGMKWALGQWPDPSYKK
jgi:hypothetical protein